MFELKITRHRKGTEVRTFDTLDELHVELLAMGVPRQYWGQGYWAFDERYDWAEIVADAPVNTRRHTYCDGTGTITLASGAPAVCMGCSGTGRVPVFSKAQRAELERTSQRHMNALARIKAYAASMASRVDNVEYLASSGFDLLQTREPHRLEKLYDSIESGRVADVVRALYDYRKALTV